jgi:uncharacterized repeat protein (TIGR02543 family)
LSSVTFQSGSKLEAIGNRAFLDTNKLTAIKIPASVTSIGDEAFRNSLELDSVRFLGNTAPIVGADAFTGVANSAKAIIESGAALAFPATGNPARWNGLEVVVPTKIYEDVSFNSKGGSFVGTRFFAGDIVAPVAPVRSGYTLAGWTETDGGSTLVQFPYAPSATSNITLFAKWTPTPYAVTYDSRGGTAVTNGSFSVLDNVAEPTAPTKAGHTFAGWTANDWGGTPITFPYAPGVTSNITLYANWNQEFVVAYDSKGGTAVTNGSFLPGGSIAAEPTAPTRDCSTFAGWSETDGGPAISSFPYTPGANRDITLYAKWNLTTTCAGTPGATPNSKVVSIPVGVTEATIPATDALPAVKLNLAGTAGQAVVTVAPISNPDPANSPFSAGQSTKVVDISVTGITGRVTVCLDGGAGENLFHFTGGAWVALPERSYVNGQVCGVTSSFSPFTAAIPAKTPAEIAAEAAAAAAAEQARLAAAELASRTISAKQKYSLRSLASQTGIKIVSPKAKVTTTVAGSSKKVCTKSGSTLKTLVAGNCVVTYTIQEPKQTIKTFKSFVVGEVGSGSALSAKSSYSMNAIASANGITQSAKGKLSMTVAKSSKGICSKSGSNLKILKAGTCNVTFTVNEPQPAATKTTKTFVVN